MIAAYGIGPEIEPGVITIPRHCITGVHLTELLPDGSGKAPVDPVRKAIGPGHGSPIALSAINDALGLAICEGIETGLSIAQATGLGVWAAGSSAWMPALAAAVPDYVECITIYAEADASGQRGASGLIDALLARGFEVLRVDVEVRHGA
jgi:hypothetical protein